VSIACEKKISEEVTGKVSVSSLNELGMSVKAQLMKGFTIYSSTMIQLSSLRAAQGCLADTAIGFEVKFD
jgi:hypothetical protein